MAARLALVSRGARCDLRLRTRRGRARTLPCPADSRVDRHPDQCMGRGPRSSTPPCFGRRSTTWSRFRKRIPSDLSTFEGAYHRLMREIDEGRWSSPRDATPWTVGFRGYEVPFNLAEPWTWGRRFLDTEPERSRRVIRLAFANWRAQFAQPVELRPKPALKVIVKRDGSSLFLEFFPAGPSAPRAARRMSPRRLGRLGRDDRRRLGSARRVLVDVPRRPDPGTIRTGLASAPSSRATLPARARQAPAKPRGAGRPLPQESPRGWVGRNRRRPHSQPAASTKCMCENAPDPTIN